MDRTESGNLDSLLSGSGVGDALISNTLTTEFELTPLEELLDKVGGEGKYQFRSFLIFNVMWFLTSWMLVGQGFFFDDSFKCANQPDKVQC